MERLISIIFHPSISSFLGFLIIFLARCRSLLAFADIIFFFSILPFLITLVMWKLGKISDLFVSRREERAKVIIIVLVGYILGSAFLYYFNSSPIFFYLSIAYIVNTLVILSISLKYKISIHVATITAISTALTMILGIKFIFFYLFSIIIGIARVKIKAHTVDQVLSAFIISIIVTFIQLKIYLGE
ncbi:hypothetical protein D1867_00475 [Acidianus infernus]|uniref:Phosphatase PAP2 family protein n=1 Tax=Acidianus infernus TaxID=12915 RepID=A0A6A9QBP2_ACIIN|nr:hypothetical protein [Acidianus infernus]MUM63755.1 hypothetical protein [Acidianus infernus]